MAIDAYSPCPGGTGKKIKFCCADFVGELEKIDRMVEGEQYLACLQTIDQLLDKEPGRRRPCLMATKGLLLRMTAQDEAAKAHAAEFLAAHPDNQIALAEAAILAIDEDARQALGLLQGALKASGGKISLRTYEAMGLVGAALLDEHYWLAGRALLQLQVAVSDEHEEAVRMLLTLNHATDIPLLLRDDPPLAPCPEEAPWRQRYLEATKSVGFGDWATAAGRLAALADDVPDSPVLWRTLATLRGWLADNDGCIQALHTCAALYARDESRLEEAVECEATAMLLAEDPLGDRLDVLELVWIVKDVEKLQEAMLSSPRLQAIPFDPAEFADDQSPPPKAAFLVLDRPAPAADQPFSLATAPRLSAQVLLYGRQTDREARLEVAGVAADEAPALKQLFAELAGEAVEPDSTEKVVDHSSASQRLLRPGWRQPRDLTPPQLDDLFAQHVREALLERWPNLRLRVFGGRSPREAAGEERYRVPVLAAILVLEFWSQHLADPFDFNQLRSQLGLPQLGPVDPQQQPVASLPLVRLARLAPQGLSDQDLSLAFRRAVAFAIRSALGKFAQAIIERPSFSGKVEQLSAYNSLARTAADLDKALEYAQQGRAAAEAVKQSSASWDLLELSLRFGRREGHEALRLIEHIQRQHIEEPGVAETLGHMLMDVGLLRPDGSPAFAPHPAAPEFAAEPPAAEPTKLWTPDSETGGSGGKLWTPD